MGTESDLRDRAAFVQDGGWDEPSGGLAGSREGRGQQVLGRASCPCLLLPTVGLTERALLAQAQPWAGTNRRVTQVAKLWLQLSPAAGSVRTAQGLVLESS